MNKYVIAILVIILGISVYFNFNNKQSSIDNNPSQLSFEKKQDCAVYKKQIEDKFEKDNYTEGNVEIKILERVFYSPKQNSCLYVYSNSSGITAPKDRYSERYLTDVLTGINLAHAITTVEGKNNFEAYGAFDLVVSEYSK